MHEITGIILAGGKSKRMGADKAFLKIGDKTLFELVMDKMLGLFNEVIAVVAQPSLYEKYSQKILIKKDVIAERGPLGGLYTGLLSSNNGYNFVTACDMPFLNEQLLLEMIKSIADSDAMIPEFNGRLHPLFGLYTKSCASVAQNQISKDNLKMRDFLGKVKTRIIKEPDIKEFDSRGLSFININTYEEYKSCCEKF